MKHITFFSMALALLALVSCKDNHPKSVTPPTCNRAIFLKDPAKIQMVTSLDELDKNRLYVMNYTVDYQLDKVLAANAAGMDSLQKVLAALLWDSLPVKTTLSAPDCGCSAYAASLSGTSYLMGRNYDFCHMEKDGHEEPATAIVLFTAPQGGKKSISFVDAYWLQFKNGFYNNDSTDLSQLVFAPYNILDGMNEDGLAISVLHLDGKPTDQKEAGKSDIYTSVAMRAVLDKCGTVSEAIDFLRTYNMHMATPANGSLHLMLADAQGQYVVAEWSFEDPSRVDSTSVPTLFVPLQADDNRYVTNFYVDPRLEKCIYGGLSQHGRDRYNTLRDTLNFYHYSLTESQAKSLLAAVAQNPNPAKPTSHTQWSNLYNLTNRTVETAILQEYGKWYQFTCTGLK